MEGLTACSGATILFGYAAPTRTRTWRRWRAWQGQSQGQGQRRSRCRTWWWGTRSPTRWFWRARRLGYGPGGCAATAVDGGYVWRGPASAADAAGTRDAEGACSEAQGQGQASGRPGLWPARARGRWCSFHGRLAWRWHGSRYARGRRSAWHANAAWRHGLAPSAAGGASRLRPRQLE